MDWVVRGRLFKSATTWISRDLKKSRGFGNSLGTELVNMGPSEWIILALVVVSASFLIDLSTAAFTPVDNYLIACGSSQKLSVHGRDYVPDSELASLSLKTSEDTVHSSSNSSLPLAIYQHLRIFPKPASYKFDIQQTGRHWIRLYFCPLPNSGHDLISASLTVVSDEFVLLNNFTFKNSNLSYLSKEYSVNVTSNTLTLTFIPWNASVSFVNGIEVVSVPGSLVPDQALALPNAPYNGLSAHALETLYRLNVGGPWLTPENDTLGRSWEPSDKYLHVNSSAKKLSVSPALIRYPAGLTAETAPGWGDLLVPYYKDFITNSSDDSSTLTVSVGPDPQAELSNAMLNGLEIMKINNDAQSLDGISSVGDLIPDSHSKSKLGIIVGVSVGVLAALGFVALCFCCFVICRSKDSHGHHPWLPLHLYGNSHTISKGSTTSQKSVTASCISLASTHHGRVFTFQEIIDFTNKFDERLLLGVGGFGKVYKGTLEDGTKVAVKRGNPRSEQGLAEFYTEIQMLSKLRHRHLVSLIGYCDERSEMILVYEYMANGPLRSHLYGANLPSLSWRQRLEICIGAARGLHHLHTGAVQSVIHRDVKTTNILLDENFVAKVSDFGLSKTGPALDQTHVSTAVKGSFGYLDPEYFRRQQLTEKSDVYSFGVVLMEVLCTRPALNPVLPREQVNIAEWAMSWQKKGMLEHIMDPALVGKVNPASLKKYGETAEKCLAEQGVDRPTMGDVLWNLEYALQLEETVALIEPDENSTNHIPVLPLPRGAHAFGNSASMIEPVNSGTDDDAEDAATSAVFSQLVNPRGR
ncbi:hypothetical protein Taro_012558 [Colocasia esculenta]|uniref:Protein kinase domain-containing protein n=1 Tax=Colocasia esculenta TaxID=4460 RepID=A0A843UDV7_COLES|nr:hypothetical protein [Colocasia esculenta]